MMEPVKGFCPMCGRDTLFLGWDMRVTCKAVGCSNPGAVSDLLADRETEHLVTFEAHGYKIRHPLRERINDELLHCEFGKYVDSFPGPPVAQGRYRAQVAGDSWAFTLLSGAGDNHG